ncbi:unnamed protein product, partial [Iphiclides podalirius]
MELSRYNIGRCWGDDAAEALFDNTLEVAELAIEREKRRRNGKRKKITFAWAWRGGTGRESSTDKERECCDDVIFDLLSSYWLRALFANECLPPVISKNRPFIIWSQVNSSAPDNALLYQV